MSETQFYHSFPFFPAEASPPRGVGWATVPLAQAKRAKGGKTMEKENLNPITDSGGASNSVPQTPEIGVFFEDIGVRVEKVQENKYVLKSKYGYYEDRTLTGILAIMEAMFGKKYVKMVHEALGE
jgi:hypothetical protein